MKNETTTYEWTASNNSTFLTGRRTARTLLGAVRAARNYLRYELCGEGVIHIFEAGGNYPIRIDEKSIFTGNRWEVRTGSEI